MMRLNELLRKLKGHTHESVRIKFMEECELESVQVTSIESVEVKEAGDKEILLQKQAKMRLLQGEFMRHLNLH